MQAYLYLSFSCNIRPPPALGMSQLRSRPLAGWLALSGPLHHQSTEEEPEAVRLVGTP